MPTKNCLEISKLLPERVFEGDVLISWLRFLFTYVDEIDDNNGMI
jgi:hypothetical protein